MDLLADGWPELLDMIAPALEHADCFTPNDDQVRKLTGVDDPVGGARILIARGATCVAVTCGADGAVVVTSDGETRVPAYAVNVVDTSGCGDAFVAGLGCALARGLGVEDAARVGNAAASRVAAGTGSDHGEFTLEDVLAQAEVEHA
jgi:sugar/nucleoside kinase (ribokinase family)